MKLNPALEYHDFWLYYAHTTDKLAAEVCGLFPLEDPLSIALPCGADAQLEISVRADFFDLTLSFFPAAGDKPIQLAWWDDARWHPFALRWAELQALHEYWLDCDMPCHPSAAFLLLAMFVGHGEAEADQFKERQATLRHHLQSLPLPAKPVPQLSLFARENEKQEPQSFSKKELKTLTDAFFRRPTDEEYNWRAHAKLGWVFTGDYECYSLRNEAHSGGEEGLFPFEQWRFAMLELGVA